MGKPISGTATEGDPSVRTNGERWMARQGTNCSRPLVFACDEAYAMPLATALRSTVEANRSGRPLEVYVLSDGVSEKTRRKVVKSLPQGSASIHWIPVNLSLFGNFSTIPYISKMTYARFLIPHIFAERVSRVLYLDADILVLDDLQPLWETDLEGTVLGAVLDRLNAQLKGGRPNLEGVPRVRNYFNAGVLVIDLDQWRKERISEKALDYLTQNPRSPFSDQDALNVACDGLWKKLDARWNFPGHFGKGISDMQPEQRPGIVHFVTDLKPWDASVRSLNANFYDSLRSRTCFARTTLDKLWDILKHHWSSVKSSLRQYAFLRVIWSQVRPPRRA